jgi:hypothetical protein
MILALDSSTVDDEAFIQICCACDIAVFAGKAGVLATTVEGEFVVRAESLGCIDEELFELIERILHVSASGSLESDLVVAPECDFVLMTERSFGFSSDGFCDVLCVVGLPCPSCPVCE